MGENGTVHFQDGLQWIETAGDLGRGGGRSGEIAARAAPAAHATRAKVDRIIGIM